MSLCSQCDFSSHTSHDIINLVDKIDEDRKRLKTFLHRGNKMVTEAIRREMNESTNFKSVENSVSIAKAQLRKQHEYLKKELDETFYKELEEIER